VTVKKEIMLEITEQMQMAGVTPNLLRSKRMIICPKCNYKFSLMYSRAIACRGCSAAVNGCNLVRCPNCDYGFTIVDSGLARTKKSAKTLDKYMARILSEYCKSFNVNPRK
jgi:hypothetical protein